MLRAVPNDTGWDLRVDLSLVATPILQCVKVSLGPVERAIVTELERGRFDQAPVRGRHSVDGIVDTSHLRELLASGRPLMLDDPEITFSRLAKVSPLREVFRALIENRAFIVLDKVEREADRYEYIGLVTIADLNRRALRPVIYTLMAELETSLADLIGRVFPDPSDWFKLLSEGRRAAVRGHWEDAKNQGVDVQLIEGTTLTDLLNVAEKSPSLQALLGFPTASQIKKFVGVLPELRNRVMHPNRRLVPRADHVEDVQLRICRAINLTSRADGAETLPH